jgi:uncharacterized protein (DUF2249 family)
MTFVALYIDPAIPLPSRVRTPIGQAMRALEVGESFMVTDEADYTKARARWSNHAPAKFAMRKVPHVGWRLWRVE